MDKIREEFEKFKKYQGAEYPQYFIDPSDPWSTHLHTFEAGYKVRDEEVKILNQDCKNLVDVNNNQAKIMESRDPQVKKLRAYLERIIVDYNQHLNYDNFPECTIYWFANRAQYLAEEALKDG